MVKLGMVPTDFARHYTDNCGMTAEQIVKLWLSGGEGPGWKVSKYIINLYTKEYGVAPNYEQECQYALTKKHLLLNMSWEELEAENG